MPADQLNCVLPGTNLDKCVKVARDLGIEVAPVKGTGEIRFTYPGLAKSVRVNGRRKDAPLALSKFINEVWRIQHVTGRVGAA